MNIITLHEIETIVSNHLSIYFQCDIKLCVTELYDQTQ